MNNLIHSQLFFAVLIVKINVNSIFMELISDMNSRVDK